MSFMNKIFGSSKKEHQTTPNVPPASVINDTLVEKDGFMHVEHNRMQGSPLPYPVATTNPILVGKQQPANVKPMDDIPFQFSQALWSDTGSPASGMAPNRLKTINWDTLSYDFTLEKSITQS